MKITYAFLFLLCLCLAGCAMFTPTPGEHYLSWQARQKQLTALNSWNLQSAVGIKNLKQRITAHVNWQQADNNYILNITSQFNIGGVKIVGDSNQVILWRSTTNKFVAKNPEELMFKELGWSLPVSNLRHWILGLPVPNKTHILQFDAYNHLIHLQQQGWHVSYADFISVDNIDLPTTILLTNAKLQIKIVIKEWRLS